MMTFDRRALITPQLPDLATLQLPTTTRLVPLERHLSAIRSQFIRGVLLGILVTSAVALPAFMYSNSRQRKASPQKTSAEKTIGSVGAPAVSPARESASGTPEISVLPLAASKPQSSKTSINFSDNALQPTAAKPRSQPPVSSLGSQPPPLAVLPSPEPRNTKASPATPQQLWSSVQAGNAQAAVALADRYLRGDGVPVNCDQARVLLLAASKQNNAEASRKLQDLDHTGCPTP